MLSSEETAGFDDLIRDLLLAMISAQNEANKAYIESINELATTTLTIDYKNVDDDKTNKKITGSALAFGITPSLIQIQSGVIEIKTALSISENTTAKISKNANTSLKNKANYRFKAATIDARYQNTYNYKSETSSTIKITVVPVPASQQVADIIKAYQEKAPIKENTK